LIHLVIVFVFDSIKSQLVK